MFMAFLKGIDFPLLIANKQNGRLRIRLMAPSHINNLVNRTRTAKYIHVGRRMVKEWVKRFDEKGIDGLIEKHRFSRRRVISTQQLENLKSLLKHDVVRLKATHSTG
jgi:transposase